MVGLKARAAAGEALGIGHKAKSGFGSDFNRPRARSAVFGHFSIPRYRPPNLLVATSVVPVPTNGSSVSAPGLLAARTIRSKIARGI
jgi:hypothetical protein